MRLLLDHCVDRRLAASFPTHDVRTAADLGWEQPRNGVLLARAAADGFGAVLTTDTNLKHEQNLKTLPVSVVVMRAPTNRLADLLPLVPLVEKALAVISKGLLVEVGLQQ